ncbi:MAG: squalene synthase HpnC, partial [Rubrivivax sp.]
MPVDHYENFPVASRLCPPRLRPAVVAIYHFARTADDLADEGEVSTESRLAALADYRADLERMLAGEATTPRWAPVFLALAKACDTHALPAAPLRDLLSAFEQDTGSPRYADRTELLDYCRRSANPIGRLLLHLYGVRDAEALKQSDDICTALQLINFWQDLSVDLPRRRVYLPDVERQAFAVADEAALDDAKRLAPLVAALCDWAEELMHQGA